VKNFIKIFAVILLFESYFLAVKASSAITFNISGIGSTLNQDDEIGVNIEVGGLSSDTAYFLQTRIKSSSGNNYFGYTKNTQNNWYKYSGSLTPDEIQSQFFSFTTDKNGSWSGEIKSKIDTEDSNYKGSGDYILQALRYTGNSKSESGISNDYDFKVLDTRPTPTSVPAPTDTPLPTSKPMKTPTSFPLLEDSPELKSNNMPSSSPTIKKLPTGVDFPVSGSQTSSGDVLGLENTQSPKKENKGNLQKGQNNWGKIYIVIGVILVCIPCGILAYKKYREEKEEEI
jgi:hypothetical protein